MSSSRSFCRIVNDGIFVDGKLLWAFDQNGATENLTAYYKQAGFDYPKFYKMDLLSKTAFLAVELLKQSFPRLVECADDAVGLLFANSESSSATDLRFRESYENEQLPSPSLFVYTLPNVAMGEVAIRNKWYGAQMFAVFPNFAPDYFVDFGSMMLGNDSAFVIGGWVDIRDSLDALFFVVDGVMPTDKINMRAELEEIYNKHRN